MQFWSERAHDPQSNQCGIASQQTAAADCVQPNNDQFGKEGLRPYRENSPFETKEGQRGI